MKKILFFVIFFSINPLCAENNNLKKECITDVVKIDFNFSGTGNVSCKIIDSRYIKIFIKPELDDSINPSPWFSFRKSKHSESIKVELDYMDYSHRYYPKVSTDKINWKSIDKSSISLSKKDKAIAIDFPPSVQQEYIASQELVTESWYYDWYDKLEGSGKVKAEVIGFSVLRKPIIMFSVEGDTKNPYILIIGRQHPPEVTGVFAIKSFINELISSNELSENFLSQYNVIFIPLMNPDGVENGYWRYNENKKDLNRDWGKFSQPETIAVNEQLNKFITNRRLILFIDFHSTYKNIFYISDTFNSSIKKEFLKYWLDDSSADLLNLGYDYLIINSKAIKNGVAKNYIHNKFKVPSLTYEVSDTENRNKIKKSSSILAKKMMENLLKLD